MYSAALGAVAKNEGKMIFIIEAHEKFYYEELKEARYQDEYHKAMKCLQVGTLARESGSAIGYTPKLGIYRGVGRHWLISGINEFLDAYNDNKTEI